MLAPVSAADRTFKSGSSAASKTGQILSCLYGKRALRALEPGRIQCVSCISYLGPHQTSLLSSPTLLSLSLPSHLMCIAQLPYLNIHRPSHKASNHTRADQTCTTTRASIPCTLSSQLPSSTAFALTGGLSHSFADPGLQPDLGWRV